MSIERLFNETPNPIFIVAGMAAAAGLLLILRNRRRKAEMLRLAERRGLTYMGWDLPGDFPSYMLDNAWRWDKADFVIYGLEAGDRLLAFDVFVGVAHQTRRITVAARRSANPRPNPLIAPKHSQLFINKDWSALILERSFAYGSLVMRPSLIEEIWDYLA